MAHCQANFKEFLSVARKELLPWDLVLLGLHMRGATHLAQQRDFQKRLLDHLLKEGLGCEVSGGSMPGLSCHGGTSPNIGGIKIARLHLALFLGRARSEHI